MSATTGKSALLHHTAIIVWFEETAEKASNKHLSICSSFHEDIKNKCWPNWPAFIFTNFPGCTLDNMGLFKSMLVFK